LSGLILVLCPVRVSTGRETGKERVAAVGGEKKHLSFNGAA
jgi:hypothetical protein